MIIIGYKLICMYVCMLEVVEFDYSRPRSGIRSGIYRRRRKQSRRMPKMCYRQAIYPSYGAVTCILNTRLNLCFVKRMPSGHNHGVTRRPRLLRPDHHSGEKVCLMLASSTSGTSMRYLAKRRFRWRTSLGYFIADVFA